MTLRCLIKWTSTAWTIIAVAALVLNASGFILTYLADSDSISCDAGLIRWHQPVVGPSSGMEQLFDVRMRQPRWRCERQDPVWRTGSWGWLPSYHSGYVPGIRLWGTGRFNQTQIPIWLIALPAVAIAAPLWNADIRRWRRRRSGLCIVCGYPLAGLRTGTSGLIECPECSTSCDSRRVR